MYYQIDLTGIHCEGCTRLIKLTMEESDFQVCKIDLVKRQIVFSNPKLKTEAEINTKLATVFSELPGYGYSNLTSLN